MINRTEITIQIDGSRTPLYIFAGEDRWGIHTLCGSESEFRWTTLEQVLQWLRSDPDDFTFKAVSDDISSQLEPGTICAIVVGRLNGLIYLGYLGLECFRGGITSLEDLNKVIETLQTLRP